MKSGKFFLTVLLILPLLVAATARADLTGYYIGVDPGHGGSDSGAVGPTGLTEKEINLETGLDLRDYLQAANATVTMSRTTDVYVSLSDRVAWFNSEGVDRMISVHHNSSTSSSANYTGVHCYLGLCYGTSGNLAYDTVQRLNDHLGIGFVSSNCSPSRQGVHEDDFYVLHHTTMPAVLTEVSFISNPDEETRLRNSAYLDANAWEIYAGLSDHLGQAVTTPTATPSPTPTPNGTDYIVDNLDAGYSDTGAWDTSTYGTNYASDKRYSSSGTGSGHATWSISLPPGQYRLWAWVNNSAYTTQAEYTINHMLGTTSAYRSQENQGGGWDIDLGTYYFDGASSVTITDNTANGMVVADAVKWELIAAVTPTPVPPTHTPIPPTSTPVPPTNTPSIATGDRCDDPFVITSLPYQDTRNSGAFADNYDEVCNYPDSTSPDVVYRYYSPVSQIVEITLCQAVTDYDSKLYIYENTCPDSGNPVACNDDDCNQPEYPSPYQSALHNVTFSAYQTYYIVVDGYGGSSGNYQLNVSVVPPTSTPTSTPVPPTSTPIPPTSTPVPPTSTPIPPTSTPVPPTVTPTPSNDSIWVQNVFGCNSYTLEVPVSMDNQDTEVDAFTFHLGFDDGIFSYVSCREGSLNPGWTMFDCNESAAGDITVSGFTTGSGIPAGSNGTLVILTFDVNCSACVTGDTFAFTISGLLDDIIAFSHSDGQCTYDCSITPTPTPQLTPACDHHGDVNLDGSLSAGDAQLAFNIALETYTPTYTEFCAADCNNDGAVSAGDAQTIFSAALSMASCADPLN